jgi:hypothetical protein
LRLWREDYRLLEFKLNQRAPLIKCTTKLVIIL